MKLSKPLASILMAVMLLQPVHATSISYLINSDTDTLRFQLDKKQDNLRLYQELNVRDVSSVDSALTGRVIGQYGVTGFNLTTMGTYANGYKQHVVGLGTGYKSYGVIIGIDDQEKPVGLVYGRYSRGYYSVGGHVDVMEDLTRGRVDLMYQTEGLSVGYEAQFVDSNIANFLKLAVKF